MGALTRAFDWARTPVGPIDGWPQSLRTALSILLDSRFPMYIAWDRGTSSSTTTRSDTILGTKHPRSLGGSSVDTWAEIWPDFVGPLFNKVRTQGEATYNEDLLVSLNRFGYTEECYFTFCYSPIREESGAVGGVLVTCMETTARVVGERRLRTLRDLEAQLGWPRPRPTCAGMPQPRSRTNHSTFRSRPRTSSKRMADTARTHRIVGTRWRRRGHSRHHRSHREQGSAVATARCRGRRSDCWVLDCPTHALVPMPPWPWPEPPRECAIVPVFGPAAGCAWCVRRHGHQRTTRARRRLPRLPRPHRQVR
jgi:hypothetical protein